MTYVRKTRDVFDVQANYGQGWEDETSEFTHKEARDQIKSYRENGVNVPMRIKKSRERIA